MLWPCRRRKKKRKGGKKNVYPEFVREKWEATWRATVCAPRAVQSLTPQSTKKRGRSLLRFGHRDVGSGRPMTAAQQFTFQVNNSRFSFSHAFAPTQPASVGHVCLRVLGTYKKPASGGHVQKEGYPTLYPSVGMLQDVFAFLQDSRCMQCLFPM
jgi:hypothetical protein